MPSEMQKFQSDLFASVRQTKSGEAARTTQVKQPEAAEAREKMGLTQQAIASMLGVSPRTLQD